MIQYWSKLCHSSTSINLIEIEIANNFTNHHGGIFFPDFLFLSFFLQTRKYIERIDQGSLTSPLFIRIWMSNIQALLPRFVSYLFSHEFNIKFLQSAPFKVLLLSNPLLNLFVRSYMTGSYLNAQKRNFSGL